MRHRLVPRGAILAMLIAAVILPIAISLIVAVAALLGAMGDAAGQAVLGRIALAGGLVWGINLVCLLLVQALSLLGGDDDTPGDLEE